MSQGPLIGVDGTRSDAAVVSDTTGSHSGKLRGLVKWAFERMPVSLGQKARAASLAVTLSTEDVATLTPPAAISGFATATKQDTGNTSLATIDTSTAAAVVGESVKRDAALTNAAVSVKATPGRVHGYNLFNPGVALAYVHFYDLAFGSVVVGTTVPVFSIALPSNANAQIGVDVRNNRGVVFATAISMAASTTPGGGTAPASACVANAFFI